MSKFLMKPKIDFAFKEIMTDEKARTGFLSAVLNLASQRITGRLQSPRIMGKIHQC